MLPKAMYWFRIITNISVTDFKKLEKPKIPMGAPWTVKTISAGRALIVDLVPFLEGHLTEEL